MYGRLIDGDLLLAPKKLTIGEVQVWNAPTEEYIAQGWLPVTFVDCPAAPDGFFYVSAWQETDEEILQTWTLEEYQGEDYAEAGRILMGVEE